ncbi:MAG TPA: phosphatase PAP2 family protein, partial [Xanthobacteraceae bacterium]|nr:phosphatase PAP2 family protein [Xanthobacteraceae bacterium]
MARFVHTLPWAESLRSPVRGAPVLAALGGVATLVGAFWAKTGHTLKKLQEVLIIASFSLAVSVCLDEFVLRPFFGRQTPDEFLLGGKDAFHWFQGSFISSFPSGHAVQIVSVGTIFFAAYPRQRPFWLALMGIGL